MHDTRRSIETGACEILDGTGSPSRGPLSWVDPWGPIWPLQQPVRLVVAGHAPGFGVPGQGPADLQGEVRQDATGRRDVTLLDVGHRLAARGGRLEEVEHVAADRRGDVFFQILL